MSQLFICLMYTKINTVKLLRNLVHDQPLKSSHISPVVLVTCWKLCNRCSSFSLQITY